MYSTLKTIENISEIIFKYAPIAPKVPTYLMYVCMYTVQVHTVMRQ